MIVMTASVVLLFYVHETSAYIHRKNYSGRYLTTPATEFESSGILFEQAGNEVYLCMCVKHARIV